MCNNNGYTPTQQRILAVLADGRRHDREELRLAIDELCSEQNLKNHLKLLRDRMRPRGEDIVCVIYQRRGWYQHVRLLANPYRA